MELVINSVDLEPEPLAVINPSKPQGILDSKYKRIVKNSYNVCKSPSVFGIRQRLNSRRHLLMPNMATALKLSVFLIALVAIF